MTETYVVVRGDGRREEPSADYTLVVSRVEHLAESGETARIDTVGSVVVAVHDDPHRTAKFEER